MFNREMMDIYQQHMMNQTEIKNDDYPRRLSSIVRAPLKLYYMGDIDIINRKRNIAVIGSRRVSEKGIELAYRTGYELGRRGINVVNGLALGCDAHALRGALEAGGTCVAVMPCGLDQIVPYSNTGLAQKLLSNGGCLLSEYPVQTPVHGYQYVERDRLQSGISDGVIVIEAECDSGTMYTVKYAIRQGRRLACIDSQLIRYSSGNRWIEGQNGVCVIRDAAGFNAYIDDLYNDPVYRQITFGEFELTND